MTDKCAIRQKTYFLTIFDAKFIKFSKKLFFLNIFLAFSRFTRYFNYTKQINDFCKIFNPSLKKFNKIFNLFIKMVWCLVKNWHRKKHLDTKEIRVMKLNQNIIFNLNSSSTSKDRLQGSIVSPLRVNMSLFCLLFSSTRSACS